MATGAPSEISDGFQIGQEFSMNSKDFYMDRLITKQEYLSGTCFGRGFPTASIPNQSHKAAKQFVPPKPASFNKAPVDSATRPERGIPLQPINLFNEIPAKEDVLKPKARDSHWTVNW